MFAVVILGIGFIMVAAIFPVAIQQSQTNTQESVSASVVRGAVNYLEQVSTGSDNHVATTPSIRPLPLFPATGGWVLSSPYTDVTGKATAVGDYNAAMDEQWRQLRGNAIVSEDPRFAFVTLYRRPGTVSTTVPMATNADWAAYAQVIVIPVQCRTRPTFTSASVNPANAGTPTGASQMAPVAELQPQPTLIQIENDGAGPGVDVIRFWKGDAPFITTAGAVAEGAFVVVANDANGVPALSKGLMNGHVFKVGARRSDLDQNTTTPPQHEAWELAAGFDFSTDGGADGVVGTGGDDITRVGGTSPVNKAHYVNAFVVGRGYANPDVTPSTADQYEGTSMAVSAYSTWVRVR